MLDHTDSSTLRRWRLPAGLVVAVLVAAACGGGGSSGSASPQSFSTGAISGFGSIVVNGVHFDESRATVTDDDDAAFARTGLALGMVVEIKGDDIVRGSSKSTSNASEVVVRSAIKGPVEAVDATAGTLTVLGQKVSVASGTIFEGVTGGLSGLSSGNLVEVYGLLDTQTGILDATRIELKTTLGSYKLRGVVASLNTGAMTFRIGDALISYAQVPMDQLPALSDGLLVRVKLRTTQEAGAWVATKIKPGVRRIEERTEAEAEGFVTDFVSLSNFKVDGLAVDASGAAVSFVNGVVGDLMNGVRVEVEGQVVGGVLVASKVSFKRADRQDENDFELSGTVQAVDLTAGTLTVRDTPVKIGDFTTYRGGSATGLTVGRRVEVKAQLQSDGTTLQAVLISFEG